MGWILGLLEEIDPMSFEIMQYEVSPLIESVHKIALNEFLSRTLVSMWDWEIRTQHMFQDNRLNMVNDVIVLPSKLVDRLKGCGYKTRKEVYDIFTLHHVKLHYWSPDKHWGKNNYKFEA